MISPDDYYNENIRFFRANSIIKKAQLLKMLVMKETLDGRVLTLEKAEQYLGNDFVRNCIDSKLIIIYEDDPIHIYLNNYRINNFITFLKSNPHY